ncbi:hypothetical protein KJ707_03045 [Patescibacteria group bacterium]|nr:hypothetical protein [Patescibacteria group bacterium]MBU1966870.1 hypothetical protein [Patescibacteria group bacterium]MBU2543513.1 hypothetical protein [Patescibacteria group bacterium]
MKKLIPLMLAILIIGGGIFIVFKSKSKSNTIPEITQKKRIEEPTNVIAVSERPYIQITPNADGHNLSLIVNEIKKDATSVQYELEYQAGSLLQGAFGKIELNSLPAVEKILLGSCSAGGACSFHEDVQGGSLLTRFDGPEPYALKSRWKYIDNAGSETTFSSQDAKFQIDSKDLKKQRYLVIFNTAGYPDGLKREPVSEIYSLTGSSKLSGTANLTIRAQEEGEFIIMGFDGQQWHEFDTTTSAKMASAEVKLMELYVLVK